MIYIVKSGEFGAIRVNREEKIGNDHKKLINKIDVKKLLGRSMKRCLVSENTTTKQKISKVS